MQYVGLRSAISNAVRSALWIATPISYTTVSTFTNLAKLLALAVSLILMTALLWASMIGYALILLVIAPFGFTGGAIREFAKKFEGLTSLREPTE